MRTIHTSISVCALCALLSGTSAHAQTLFTNLPYSMNNGSAFVAGPNSTAVYTEQSIQFTPSMTAYLGSVQVPFINIGGFTNNQTVTIGVYTNLGDHPGALLASGTIPAGTMSQNAALYTISFDGSLLLTSGKLYFVDAIAAGSTEDGWINNSANTYFPVAYRTGLSDQWSRTQGRMGLQVNGVGASAVPEPGSISLVIGFMYTGFGTLLRRQRTRK